MTKVYLLNVPFENNYKDTMYFSSIIKQKQYMDSRVVHTFNDFSYQRKEHVIRIPAHIDTLYNCNYVMYQNEYTDIKTEKLYNKWFYAFITDMQYINDGRTDITIETDVIQTWMDEYTVKPSFVEREHVNDDTPGINTVPEQLETGEYVCDGRIDESSLTTKGIVIGCTVSLEQPKKDGKFIDGGGNYYNGVFSGVNYYYFPPITNEEGRNPFSAVTVTLERLASAGQSDAVVSIFMVPTSMIRATKITTGDLSGHNIYNLDWSNSSVSREWAYYTDDEKIEKPKNIGEYTPRNSKLLTYPYCSLVASNNSGGANEYHYELFGDQINFKIIGSITPGMSIRMIPLDYSNIAENNNEGLNLGKFPICAWTTDVYTNWLVQNGANIATNLLSGGAQILGGALIASGSGGALAGIGAGTIAGGVSQIASVIGQVSQHSFIPPAVEGNINSGDVTYSSGMLTFSLYKMRIKKEYAQIIDEYFDMFGYKVNRVKVPNNDHRRRYWYTKTIDVNIDGAIPNKDLEKIKECYNKGITFWRNGSDMGNYATNENKNPIVAVGSIK